MAQKYEDTGFSLCLVFLEKLMLLHYINLATWFIMPQSLFPRSFISTVSAVSVHDTTLSSKLRNLKFNLSFPLRMARQARAVDSPLTSLCQYPVCVQHLCKVSPFPSYHLVFTFASIYYNLQMVLPRSFLSSFLPNQALLCSLLLVCIHEYFHTSPHPR